MQLTAEMMKAVGATTGAVDDSYHLGHLFMDYMVQNPEDHIWQIDAGTGKSENKLSVKTRTLRLARSLRNAGLKPGDAIVVSGRNHLDLVIPIYAAYLNGHPYTGIDVSFKYEEVKRILDITKPKWTVCEVESYDLYWRIAKDLGLDMKIVTFGDGDNSMADFLEVYDDNAPEDEFKVATFDTNKVYAWLICTSGTNGMPKVAGMKHHCVLQSLRYSILLKEKEIKPVINFSSVQWASSYLIPFCMITSNQIKVQTSSPVTVEHAIDIINKYKPAVVVGTPGFIDGILKNPKYCDLTCFDRVILTGWKIVEEALQQLKSKLHKDAVVWNLYGQTECVGPVLMPVPDGPRGNAGKQLPMTELKLVNMETGATISEPNAIGELWYKGPRFDKYLNNPEDTAQALTADGWYRTGDLLYRDENGFYFFVERMSSSFRYRGFFVMPMEVEQVIKRHPDVVDVCVIGVPHPDEGARPLACVVRRPGSRLTEQDVKDLVANVLSHPKQLHGGVVFFNEFPRTVSGKIVIAKVRDMVLSAQRSEESDLPCAGTVKKLISTFQQLSEESQHKYVAT